jgi:hypothetical protein
MKNRGLFLAAVVGALALGGVALGAGEPPNSNGFRSPTSGSDNPLVLNGTVKVEDVALAATATFVEGTESSDRFDVQLTFKDGGGNVVAHVVKSYCWASEASSGAGYVTTAGTSAFAAITNGAVESITSGKTAHALSTAAGLLGVRVTQTSATAPNQYLCCTVELGPPVCSAALDWT